MDWQSIIISLIENMGLPAIIAGLVAWIMRDRRRSKAEIWGSDNELIKQIESDGSNPLQGLGHARILYMRSILTDELIQSIKPRRKLKRFFTITGLIIIWIVAYIIISFILVDIIHINNFLGIVWATLLGYCALAGLDHQWVKEDNKIIELKLRLLHEKNPLKIEEAFYEVTGNTTSTANNSGTQRTGIDSLYQTSAYDAMKQTPILKWFIHNYKWTLTISILLTVTILIFQVINR